MGGLLSPIKEVEAILESDDVIMLAGAKMLDTTIICLQFYSTGSSKEPSF